METKKHILTTLIVVMASMVFSSCGKDDEDGYNPNNTMLELRWVEGNYTGTYGITRQSWTGTTITKEEVKAKVSLNPDTTMNDDIVFR